MFPDSDGERRFAEDMDAAAEVAVYAKLPRTFQIPTPVGNYAPDWAIAFKGRQRAPCVLRRRDQRAPWTRWSSPVWENAKNRLRQEAFQRDEHGRRALPQRGDVLRTCSR